MAEQLSMLEETRKEKIKKQMKQAVTKGIIPEATVIIDKDKNTLYQVAYIYVGHDCNLEVNIQRPGVSMPWNALSDRLTVL
ncbi:hypothetical protein B0P06_004188 [Clostridium saccharoperbutylacetonicum]|uniref:Uncharacterized protein n=2 Tax=Clostridium saccharoperbutylacetonicum TaxID=36745 RepID=M1MHV1_9CLOT|nr:hypothetical protein [Clostridium saccharoperbutylacetonicum]AGF57509.1 hypothetical protein Cspa_c37490 [Clostridium saccharoperbutylacetonicum N1-4(HMT)]NRT61723.1 hypothetical protein [Clostridium saccharoperbutylacetonicum]NSB25048.1 hypothetical protein [Clostridium saccharoperbutylacetonicum]NSB44417.1 hypothetical protein [Clostridium saccharoperbutylacetonicum]